MPAKNIIPGKVAVDKNNQTELDQFLEEQERIRQ